MRIACFGNIQLLFLSGDAFFVTKLSCVHCGTAGCPRGLTLSWWGRYGLCLRRKPSKLAHSFYSVLVSVSVFMALSTVFYSINSPDNSLLSYSVLAVLFLPYWSFQRCISL